jgi:transcriptional regulator with XRE-family HTH domain
MSDTTLDAVLEEYAAATPSGNDLVILRALSEKYPQFAGDLADYAAARAVLRHSPAEDLSRDEEHRYGELGLTNLQSVLGLINANSATQNALESLTETAKSKGLNRSKFAEALGLSTSLLTYLEKRRVDFSSIPKEIVATIAGILQVGEESVSAYLSGPRDLAPGASFKTGTRPQDLPAKSFSDAVREDQQLSAEQKKRLLQLP